MNSGKSFARKMFSRRLLKNCLFGLVCCALSSSLSAATLTWTNSSGGNWNNAANWSPNQVPGTNDSATLLLSVRVTNNASVSVSNFIFSAATLKGSGAVTVNGAMFWAGGDLCSAIVIAPTGTLTVSNTVTFGFDNGSQPGGG